MAEPQPSPHRPVKRASLVLLLLLVAAAGAWFHFKKPAESETGARVAFQNLPASLADIFSGEKALAHVKAVVDLGPRPPASEGYEKTLKYLESEFSGMGWITTRQSFTRSTPKGPVVFTNLLARHGSSSGDWTTSVPVVIGGHLDSKGMEAFPFAGANDGGSSTGVIMELARVLATDPTSAAKVEFVLFDGEEAILSSITESDGLYGSKYYAHEISKRSTWPSLGIVLDLVGDSTYEFYFNPETPPAFATAAEKAAEASGLKLKRPSGPIIDDHVPLQQTGLPCLHLIGDFMNMPYWHQKEDTMEIIDADALEKTGRTTLRFLATVPAP
jgi:glutaminyl-peptide cyclotransferase